MRHWLGHSYHLAASQHPQDVHSERHHRGAGVGRAQYPGGGAGLRNSRHRDRHHHLDRPGPGLYRRGVVIVAGLADPRIASDHAGRHPVGHGLADHAGLHRAGGAAGACTGQARCAGRGSPPVCAVFRGAVCHHATGSDGSVCGKRHFPRHLDADQLGRSQAGPNRIHHSVHVRVRTVIVADRRFLGRGAVHVDSHSGCCLSRWRTAQLLLLRRCALVGAANADRRSVGVDQARSGDRPVGAGADWCHRGQPVDAPGPGY